MKKLYFFFSFLLFSLFVSAQNAPFITTWEVTSNDLEITIPTEGTGYDYTVDFGDGTVLNNQTGDVTHTYNSVGTYTVSVSGDFPRIFFGHQYPNLTDEALKLKTVEQWGDIEWSSMQWAFLGCFDLVINANDTPDLSQVTNMWGMFESCTNFNSNINNWDVSNITMMYHLFYGAENFNQPLDNWDVSNVFYMNGVFEGCTNFNQPLNNWNVSNVADFAFMFKGATAFNQPLNNWDVSNVNDPNTGGFAFMFDGAENFDQPLEDWDINTFSLQGFLNGSNLSVENYDKLLSKLTYSNLQNIELGASGLEYCDAGKHQYLTNTLGWEIIGDSVSEDCNQITGNIIFDSNGDGCDANDILVNNLSVIANDGNYDNTTFPNNGIYELPILGNNFTVSLGNLPSYYTATPVSATVSFSNSDTEIVDFCITTNQTIEDLNITLIPISQARPGFDADYQLVVQNVGTQTIANPSISLAFDNTMQTFVSASPNPSSTTVNQLNFDFASIAPFESKVIDLTMNTFQPSTVNGGDILSFTANVIPNTNDNTPEDNTFIYDQTVVNSYDPNDKQVLQGEEIYEEQTDEYLDYLIRFQNTGTASAINVRIQDTLHPKLDWSTLQPINASHDYRVEITNGNQVEFIFEDINLPHEAADEPGSHGFIAYKIKPKEDVALGDIITGDAQIYFDFNAPIITNMVSTEVVQNLDTKSYDLASKLNIYPNPTNNVVHLQTIKNVQLEEVSIYNLQGKQLLNFRDNLEKLNIGNLSKGIYLIKISTNQGTINKQLIKK